MSGTLAFPHANVRTESVSIDRWQRFVISHPSSTLFHSRNWIELIGRQYRLPIRIFALLRDEQIVAGIPFLQSQSLSGRRQLVCLPLTDCMRTLAREPRDAAVLAGELRRMDFSSYARVVMKTDEPTGQSWTPTGNVRHELDLARPREAIEDRYASSTRRNIKRACRNRLRFEVRTDLQSVREFYELHLHTRRRLGIPVQPRSYFHRLHQEIISTGHGAVAVVYKDEKPISAVVLLNSPHTMMYKYAASDPASLDMRPNDFMVYQLIRHAVDRGVSVLDFGTSRLDETGLRHFKSKWGATETEVVADCFHGVSDGSLADSKLLPIMRYVIRRCPPFVCRGTGELLYRYYP